MREYGSAGPTSQLSYHNGIRSATHDIHAFHCIAELLEEDIYVLAQPALHSELLALVGDLSSILVSRIVTRRRPTYIGDTGFKHLHASLELRDNIHKQRCRRFLRCLVRSRRKEHLRGRLDSELLIVSPKARG